jgi:hypothetical protein
MTRTRGIARRTAARATPAHIGSFEIDGVLAHVPGVVRVSAGTDAHGEPVAVRVLLHAAHGEAWRAQARAAALWRQIDHPGLVPLIDAGHGREGTWVATRRVDGPTLARHLAERGPLAPASAVAILAPVAGALDLAHARGLVCDALTAETVLVRGGTAGVLTDIGPAWPSAWRPGRLLGDPDGLAPEEIHGDSPSPASNIYALAALLLRCLTGRPPFPATSRAAALLAHLATPPPRPSELRSDLPRDFDDLVASALAKEPGPRPRTASELIRLAAATLGVDGPSRASGAAAPAEPVPAAGAAPPGPPAAHDLEPVRNAEPRQRRTGWRRTMPVALLLAPAVTLVAVAVYVAAHSSPGAQTPPGRSEPPAARQGAAGEPLARASLEPPVQARHAGAPTGAVRIDARGQRLELTIAAAQLPPEGRRPVEAYNVWLLGPRGRVLRLGAIDPPVGRLGRALRRTTLPPGSSRFDRVVVTLERSLGPRPAGPVVLGGRLRIPRR